MLFELDCMHYRVEHWIHNVASTPEEFRAAYTLLQEIEDFQGDLMQQENLRSV